MSVYVKYVHSNKIEKKGREERRTTRSIFFCPCSSYHLIHFDNNNISVSQSYILLIEISMDDHKLFVGNMAARITQRDLWRFFSPYGLIDECAKFHESYAFVRFVHADDAQRARRETHGTILKGRKLKVEFAATVNKTDSSTCKQASKYRFYFEDYSSNFQCV